LIPIVANGYLGAKFRLCWLINNFPKFHIEARVPQSKPFKKWIMLPYEVHSIATGEEKVEVLQNFSITKHATIE